MSEKILFQKATRIEGNANIQIEIEAGRVKTARFLVHEFRGFEGFLRGMRVENVPHIVSRICGLCSSSHQVAAIRAIEEALAVKPPKSVQALRDILVLGEWISSHALSYFFLTVPDFVGISGGIFELMEAQPEIAREAFFLRNAGLAIVKILGRRTSHPVTIGVGRFTIPINNDDLEEIHRTARDVKERVLGLIDGVGRMHSNEGRITFPSDQQINFVCYDSSPERDSFCVYDLNGELKLLFSRAEFMDNISEMRADWTLAKFPYLRQYGFPAGIMLVGPLARTSQPNSLLYYPEFQHLNRIRISATGHLSRSNVTMHAALSRYTGQHNE
ncbi:MAG: nickel-dependent hydrogenase large subunit [Nitrospirota bacterium]